MTFLSILIALVMERIMPQLVSMRRFVWLRDYSRWMVDVLHVEKLGPWAGFVALILPLLFAVWLLESIFDNALFGLFELVFNVAVIYLCLGPKDLDKQVDAYVDALEIGETQQRIQAAGDLTGTTPAVELPGQVSQVCKSIFVAANTRIYAILFLFVLLGPVAVVLYRLLEQLMLQNLLIQTLTQQKLVCRSILSMIDWIPSRISLVTYMLSGSFEEGLQAYRKSNICAVDLYEQNHLLLEEVGFQSICQTDILNDQQAIQVVRKARGLVLRALVVWLLLILLYSYFV